MLSNKPLSEFQKIESVKCTNGMNNQCELKGEGLDYISQVSTDGGRSWFPQSSGATLQVQPTAEGNLMMMIPMLINQKFLQIKLRDFPNTEGLTVNNFVYSNSVKKGVEKNSKDKPNQRNQAGNLNGNQPLNQSFSPNQNQSNQPMSNPPVNKNTNNGQPNSKLKSGGKGGQKLKKRN